MNKTAHQRLYANVHSELGREAAAMLLPIADARELLDTIGAHCAEHRYCQLCETGEACDACGVGQPFADHTPFGHCQNCAHRCITCRQTIEKDTPA